MCKQMYDSTRVDGARLWNDLLIPFSSAGTLHSFAAFRRRCTCSPRTLLLQARGGAGRCEGEGEGPRAQR